MVWFLRRRSRSKKYAKEISMTRHFVVGFCVFLCVSAILAGIGYGTRLPSLTITNIEVSGGETIDHEEVRAVVDSELDGSYVLLIPYRFSYLYPERAIKSALTGVPRLYNPVLERKNKTTLSVTFEEYIADALWCTDVTHNATCLFIDSKGYAFGDAPPLTGGVLMRFVSENTLPQVGEVLENTDALMYTKELIADVESTLFLDVVAVTFTETHDVWLHLLRGGYIKFTPDVSIEESLINLTTVLSSEEFSHLKKEPFDYIDVRFGTRIFVKEERNIPEVTASSSSYNLETLSVEVAAEDSEEVGEGTE